MKKRKRLFDRIPRKPRFFLDAFLTLAILFVIVSAVGLPDFGDEEDHFRRLEKANLAGPSVILDRMDVQPEWPWEMGYHRLIIGDAGEEILFGISAYKRNYMLLQRREKIDGLLLVPLPSNQMHDLYGSDGTGKVLPLFLFADDPAAVKAEVTLRLSDTLEIELSQVRGPDAPPEERDDCTRDGYFWFNIPLPGNHRSEKADLLGDLYETNAISWPPNLAFPARIRLYDAAGELLETREYLIRGRNQEDAPYTGNPDTTEVVQ